jgi:hypothetical protein
MIKKEKIPKIRVVKEKVIKPKIIKEKVIKVKKTVFHNNVKIEFSSLDNPIMLDVSYPTKL